MISLIISPQISSEEKESFKSFLNSLSPENTKFQFDCVMVGQQQQQKQPPPPPPKVFNKEATRYDPLNLPGNLNNFPYNDLKLFPKFNGRMK